MNPTSRRKFLKTSLISSAAFFTGLNLEGCKLPVRVTGNDDLYNLCQNLLQEWGTGLLKYSAQQGILDCPACRRTHGRIGDTIYPFLFLAHQNHDFKYLDAALRFYQWMEENVSQPDGSWVNEPVNSSWYGITVFTVIALAEALKNHGQILDKKDYNRIAERTIKAGNYLYDHFTMSYGNINYPVSASYALALLGELLDDSMFRSKGKYFAHESLRFFSPENKLLYGEGRLQSVTSPKGCYPVDLGYNVEESLPALVQYGLLTGDQEVLEVIIDSLKAHMEFMLPDGGWDNSWGTRNYKWTYWGSRTSDGCQTAYALLAGKDERFYKVALQNAQLLKECTHNNLLHGGPHYVSHGVMPCVHHTFCHAKALAAVLDHHPAFLINCEQLRLPREITYGVKPFKDIQTWLVSKGNFRATITGYDVEYRNITGHATGGALTMLWHELTGAIFTASLNKYQLMEKSNMQVDNDPDSMSLTPRVVCIYNSKDYTNINDLQAEVIYWQEGEEWIVEAKSKLVNENQSSPSFGDIACVVSYRFSDEKVVFRFHCEREILPKNNLIQIILPVISKQSEPVEVISDHCVIFTKENCFLKITSDHKIQQIPILKKRIFNFVPGFEALPLMILGQKAEVTVEVISVEV